MLYSAGFGSFCHCVGHPGTDTTHAFLCKEINSATLSHAEMNTCTVGWTVERHIMSDPRGNGPQSSEIRSIKCAVDISKSSNMNLWGIIIKANSAGNSLSGTLLESHTVR